MIWRIAENAAPTPEVLCTLTAVSKRYRFRGPWVLEDASAELCAGRIVEFTGPDNAGKSTLLSIIAGSTDATSGKVTRRDEGVEYSPDHLPSGLMLTGLTYLRHTATAGGHTRTEANARVEALAAGLGLTDLLRLPIANLAARASQQVALCSALASPSRLVILDDPWSRLDPIARDFLAEELVRRASAGACVIVTDEGPRPKTFKADERYLLQDGRLTLLADEA